MAVSAHVCSAMLCRCCSRGCVDLTVAIIGRDDRQELGPFPCSLREVTEGADSPLRNSSMYINFVFLFKFSLSLHLRKRSSTPMMDSSWTQQRRQRGRRRKGVGKTERTLSTETRSFAAPPRGPFRYCIYPLISCSLPILTLLGFSKPARTDGP